MLNLSEKSIRENVESESLNAFKIIEKRPKVNIMPRIMALLMVPLIVVLILPWTQNIRSYGKVTALRPDQRPQTIQTVIAGRIEKWFVSEGQRVKKGDTILYITEIKDDYFDPDLLERTDDQLKVKELSVNSYMEKVKANDNQIDALRESLKLKQEQARNKIIQGYLSIKSDSTDLVAAVLANRVADEQYQRMKELHAKGLKSLTDLETRKLKVQETQAKLISLENKLLNTRNQLINAKIELVSIQADFKDKISKIESDKYSAMSGMYDAEATVTKLQNQYTNYIVRSGYHYITAPQDGIITKALKTGVGESIKEGTEIVSILPINIDLAVEVFVDPMDVPLIEKDREVRIQFDGWPSLIFSGWPNVSYGTYGGKVIAIDNFSGTDGKFRILVVPDPKDHPWPKEVRIGGGVNSMMLLKDVPVWYEMWRQINGFPPEFYQNQSSNTKDK
ncbi:MAG TPA: HlyD family efflux transporter periplasmic adaptor subunit [Bacteroidia bacterium]